MLNLDRSQMIEGLMVYRDDSRPDMFYVIPDQPRFRIDDVTKKPVFSFIEYLDPVDNKDGTKGGGFVIFDATLTVPDDKQKKIQDALDSELQAEGLKDASGEPLKAQMGRITFTSGTASLTLLDSGGALVTKVESVGKPSLFGSMICSFTAELSPEGAAVLKAVLKKSGGVAQIAYDLHCSATLPPITGNVWFNASKAYTFCQSIDKSGGGWCTPNDTETDTLRETFTNSQCGGVYFDFSHLDISDPDAAKKTQDSITNWGWSQLDDAVKTAILPDIAPSTDRDDHGMDHISKSQTTIESSSFNRTFAEKQAVDFHIIPQGTLPNITDMGFKFEDFCTQVNADDPFFAQIHASVAVNADFEKFQINSVDVHCEYTKMNPPAIQDFHFTKPDDLGKFDSNTNNGDMEYAYKYTVNYADQPKPYASALITTNAGQITVNANQLGILYVDLAVGSVDFTKTPQVQVAITYPDADANGHPVSRQFNFTADHKADSMVAVLLKDIDQPYQYQITYIMADGTQIVTDPQQATSQELYINSPFVTHTYSFLAEADFASNVDSIFLKMRYLDEANHVDQSGDYSFTQANQNFDWKIPIVAGGSGKLTYSGVISYKNHTQENIPATDTTDDLITFGPPNQVIVSVQPDATLIDFTQVKLVKVDCEYKDATNQIDLKHEFLLKDPAAPPAPWTFYAKDPKNVSYSYTATYYLATTPPQVVTAPAATSDDASLILMMPS